MATRGARRWRLVRARREAVPASLRRLHRRFTLPRPRRSWFAAALAVVVVALLAWVVLDTSVLGVRTIEVTGAPIAGADRVRAAAAVAMGTPMARVDPDAVGTRVRLLPSVASVDVSRSWPSTLVIEVTERVPVAIVRLGSGYQVLDAAGVAFDTVARAPANVVLLRVATPGPTDPTTVAALRVVAALTPALRSQLRELVAESPTHIRLELSGSRVIVWGDAERSDLKAQVATSLLSRIEKRIDVSAPEVVSIG
jgi:cell division protein FtsQ